MTILFVKITTYVTVKEVDS